MSGHGYGIRSGWLSRWETIARLRHVFILAVVLLLAGPVNAAVLYVSALGDDSDGASWTKAFRTISKALAAVPDDKGSHRILIRPGTYPEANLFPAHRGAKNAPNVLEGDTDGSRGSGATGWVVIDSSDPVKGFKSYDWWSTIRATSKGWSPAHTEETFSAIGWDRWTLRGLYATGSDAGLFWDCTDKIEPFTVVVEDCVGIGRAFGGGVASCLSRPDEPILFRRCLLWALDWWGDTAAGYVRVHNQAIPAQPDVIFEDCTLASPQCSLKAGNFGFHTFSRVALKGCRLVTLNFSQPNGCPTEGIIQSVERGKYLHVDLEDSILMGFKVLGVRVQKDTEKEIGISTKGKVTAYVQFQQEVPNGIERIGRWPVETFAAIIPRQPRGVIAARTLPKIHRQPTSPTTIRLEGGRSGVTLYVSPLGNDADGKSWTTAFRTLSKALAAIPDAQGGHRIIVRPGHYMEANLDAAQPGAPGAYNVLEADFDGSRGSGATGWAVIDSGDPERGLKCVDWWGFSLCNPNHSSIQWDRWILRRLYMAGAEGSGWDLTNRKGAEFSAVAEDCVAVGRFSGMCVGAFVGRKDEPVTFRRCHLWALDLWGDAAGAYVRAENKTMPTYPDVVFEDCSLVSPDNALQAGNPGYDGFTHVVLRNSRLMSLNFSQPGGTPSTGIVYSTLKGAYLHTDFENCLLMGYKVFGSGGRQFGMTEGPPPGGPIPYTIKGRVEAYLQFQQEPPEGFTRLGLWPVEAFSELLPEAR